MEDLARFQTEDFSDIFTHYIISFGAQGRDRTRDFFRVKEALVPAELLGQDWRSLSKISLEPTCTAVFD